VAEARRRLGEVVEAPAASGRSACGVNFWWTGTWRSMFSFWSGWFWHLARRAA